MDPNYQLDHHQPTQSQLHAGPNSQLPDESYIEKLFPKCQPKSAQTRGGNQHQFRNRRTMRATDRQQQQQRRQNHGKHQQHQQLQQQQFRHESAGTPRRSRSTNDESTLVIMDKGVSSSNSIAGGQTLNLTTSSRNINYNCSSDSSDKDTNASGQPNVRRSNSSHVAFAINGQQSDPNLKSVSSQNINNNNSRRTKKYRASKNLQQQLKRSQSSYSKLFNTQPLPVNPNNKQDEKHQSGPSRTDQKEVAISTSQSNNKQNNQIAADGTPNGRNHSRESLAGGRRPERGNRTNRGIVFAEPISTTTNIELEPSSSSPPRPTLNETSSPSTQQLSNVGEHQAKVVAADPTPLSVKTRQHAQQRQVTSPVAAIKTADSLSPKAEAGGGQAAPVGIDETVTEIIHPVERDYSNTEQTPPSALRATDQKAPPAVVNQGKSENCETIAKLDNAENDDRFINLFVYDNTSPRKHDEVKESDKASLIKFNQSDSTISNYSEASNSTARQRDLKTSSRQLLAVDLGEEDLISNDTSTEELCSFGDQDSEIGPLKLKPAQSRPSNKTSDDGRQLDKVADKNPDIVAPTLNKSILKHHRSLSTLQTVDEKAEINIEEEKDNHTDNDLSSQATPVELSEITMIKKGFVPPGFPQRVRPIPADPSPKDQPQPLQAVSTTHVPDALSPPPGNIAMIDTPNQSTAEQNYEKAEPLDRSEESPPCLQLDNTSIRNLSEALTKVHLDTNVTLRQLKLPNEASHFSAIRPITSQSTSNDTHHHTSIQFNTLSDAESGADDEPNSNQRQSVNAAKAHLMQKRQQDFVSSSSITRYASPGSSSRADDDSVPATRTALVFPRLDEGLSSEAESCDDEVDDDDDDKAMDADVDADDDDDDEDDDDDVEDNLNLDKDSNSMQANVDHQFQHQSVKPQNRRIGSIQLQSGGPGGAQPRLPELNQVKFSEFSQQESLDQEDLKPLTNYATQNGQSNYWLGGSSQQTAMASQVASSFPRMQHGQNNSAGNNVNLSRSINYANREDVKTANRLSSDTDNETDRLLGSQRNDQLQKMVGNELVSNNSNEQQATNSFSAKQGANSREVLIEGVLFNVKYLGSTHTECEGRGEKEDRINQAELAVHEVKFRNGETHSPVEVQLFISTEKIMVLDDKHRKIMMDHSLRTISYIADIGDAIVLIVRKKSTSIDNNNELSRPISKTSCHVFESNESHTITKSISQAFQVAYTELLKANGGGDGNNYLPKELDYQEVLNSQEMSTTELEMFARKENQREVIVPKRRGEILGLSIVESGWGSVLPTAVIASLKQDGPAYRCKKLSVGDQILSINGISLVGLSLAECQKILRKTKGQSVARLSVVPCPITVEVKIKRPDTKYQLGFSVQHGVICSLLRGGIAERGGVRVGHRIISINGTTVVGVPHDKIVTLLASSVGEIRMKTCLTSLYRHMLGEEKNVSFV